MEWQQGDQKKHDAWKDRNEEVFNKAELIVAKQRNGPTGNVNVTFIDRFARFENSATVAAPEAEAVFNG